MPFYQLVATKDAAVTVEVDQHGGVLNHTGRVWHIQADNEEAVRKSWEHAKSQNSPYVVGFTLTAVNVVHQPPHAAFTQAHFYT